MINGINGKAKNAVLGIFGKTPEIMAIPIISGFQIYDSYNKAEVSEKNKVLIRDIFVLASTCIGSSLGFYASVKMKNTTSSKILKNLADILLIPFGGILSGILAGEFSEKYFPASYPKINDAVKENKKNIALGEKKAKKKVDNKLRNLLIFIITCGGVFAGNLVSGKIIPATVNSSIKKVIQFFSILAGGVAGNILSKLILNKFIPAKENKSPYDFSINELNPFDDIAKSSRFIKSELGLIFDNAYSNMSGFSVGRQQGSLNRIKKGFFEIIAGVIIPTTILLPCSKLAGYALNKTLKSRLSDKSLQLLEKIILLPVAAGAIFAGNYAGSWFNQKITDNIVKKELWQQANVMRQNLMKSAFDKFHSLKYGNGKNIKELKQNLEDLAKVERIEKNINSENID